MLHLSSSLINGRTSVPINCVAIARLSFLQACQTLPSPPTETSGRSGVHYPEFHAAIHSVCHPSPPKPFILFIMTSTLHCLLCFLAPLSFTFAKGTTACRKIKLRISTCVIIYGNINSIMFFYVIFGFLCLLPDHFMF